MGVSATFFDPAIGRDIEHLFEDNTAAVFLESPGSLTFEISDLPAISEVAKSRGASVIMDNTWGAGVFYRPLLLGADISVQALTKYAVGHADAFGGAVISKDNRHAAKVLNCATQWGIALGSDDAYMALRGLRTLNMRLKAHETNALELANWLSAHKDVPYVLHPHWKVRLA